MKPAIKNQLKYLLLRGYAAKAPVKLLKMVDKCYGLKPIRTKTDVYRLLRCLQKIFYKHPHYMTRNFNKSRFVSIDKIWAKRQATCGAMATVVASILRSKGIPVKLVDGRYGGIGENRRHAWNEIYIPAEKKYVPFDVTRKTIRLNKLHTRRRAWADWSELKKHYKPQ